MGSEILKLCFIIKEQALSAIKTVLIFTFQLFEIIRNYNVGTPEIVATFLDRALEVCQNDMTDLTRLALRFVFI